LPAVALLAAACESSNSIYSYPHGRALSPRFVVLKVQCFDVARAAWDDVTRLLTYVDTGVAEEQTNGLLRANAVAVGPVIHGQEEPAAAAESRLNQKVIESRKIPFYLETGYSREINVGMRPEGAWLFYFTRPDGGVVVTRQKRRLLKLRLTVLGETEQECTVVIQPRLVAPGASKLEPRVFKELTVRLRLWRGRTIYVAPTDQRPNTLGSHFQSVTNGEPTVTVFKISL